jgi:hypothetical protein
MVMLVQHIEITTRHKDKAILYWFGPLGSKTLRPVLRLVLLGDCVIGRIHKGSPRPPYIGQQMRSVPRLLVGYDQEI